MIDWYGSHPDVAEAEEAAAAAKGEIRQRVLELWDEGLPQELATLWGHEAINGLSERLLERFEYLRVAALLVDVDPSRFIKERNAGVTRTS